MSSPPIKIDLIASARKLAQSGQSSVSLFQHGDANVLLFVPAGVEHRFTTFSADFKAWVVFFGPQGGTVR